MNKQQLQQAQQQAAPAMLGALVSGASCRFVASARLVEWYSPIAQSLSTLAWNDPLISGRCGRHLMCCARVTVNHSIPTASSISCDTVDWAALYLSMFSLVVFVIGRAFRLVACNRVIAPSSRPAQSVCFKWLCHSLRAGSNGPGHTP